MRCGLGMCDFFGFAFGCGVGWFDGVIVMVFVVLDECGILSEFRYLVLRIWFGWGCFGVVWLLRIGFVN